MAGITDNNRTDNNRLAVEMMARVVILTFAFATKRAAINHFRLEMSMRAFIVAVSFGDGGKGILASSAIIAPNETAAVAAVAITLVQSQQITLPMTGHHCQELQEEFLARALEALRGQDGTEKIISLVPTPEPPGA